MECIGPLIDCVEDLAENPVRPTRKTALATRKLSLARLDSMDQRNVRASCYGQELQGHSTGVLWAHKICEQNAIANQARRSLTATRTPRLDQHRRRRARRVECDPKIGHHPRILHQKKFRPWWPGFFVAERLQPLEHHGNTLPAANTHGHQRVLAVNPLQLIQRLGGNEGAGTADG